MIVYQPSEKTKLRRHQTSEAIALAMQSRWEEAIATNKSIIEVFPEDVGACNRLGKALTELGRYNEAKEAYQRALEIAPNNSIAKKNLARLSYLEKAQPHPRDGHPVDPSLFIEETGKAATTNLWHPAPREVLAGLAAGTKVDLRLKGQSLIVQSANGDYLGQIEPKLASRLIGLIQGGNKYTAAIIRLEEDGVRIVIKEGFQHPSQAGRPPFPSRVADGFRPYIKDTLLKYELEEEPIAEWEVEIEASEDISPIEDAVAPQNKDDSAED